MKIFATVGTGKFDELVKALDNLAPTLGYKITIQIGKGDYVPKNCRYFRFAPSLDKYYKSSQLIVAHGGAGTTYELLRKNKKIIALANLDRTDAHQAEILRAFSEDNYLIWCKNPEKLKDCIKSAGKLKLRKYKQPRCEIAARISGFIKKFS